MPSSGLLRSPAVLHLRVYLGTALTLCAIAVTFVNAQLTDEEKKRKAREEMRAVASPTPDETPEPKATPKPATRKSKTKTSPTPKPKSSATPAAKKSPTPEPDESPTPKPKSKSATEKAGTEEKGTPKASAAAESPEPATDKKSPKPEAEKSPKAKTKTDGKKTDTEEEATPKAKAKPTESPEATKSPAARKSATPKAAKSPTPKKKPGKGKSVKKKPGPKKSPTPKKADDEEEPTKTPSLTATPAEPAATESARAPIPEPSAVPRATPPPSPQPQAALPADITIEKSGLEQEQGFEPPPPPPPRRGFWPWSRRPSYRYLTSANIDAIRRAPVQRARWKFIIVHNSGTRQGNARAFDYYHRKVRRMRNGLAYHFVIGNGTSSRNGGIEIGDRWRRQINGGHVHSDYMNNIGLGICLVGDFNRDQPTRAQLEATEELIRYLQERCGKSDGRAPMVRPHREVNPPRWATDCPGDAFPYGWFGRFR